MRHFEETFLWDILMKYLRINFKATFLWDFFMTNFNEKF